MIRAAICDDNSLIIDQITTWLGDISEDLQIQIEVSRYGDGKQIVDAVGKVSPFHVIFMDVQMAEMDGLRAAEEIRKQDDEVLIVYISNYRDYAIKSFDTSPIAYLLKPLSKEQFFSAFSKVYHEIIKNEKYFIFGDNRKNIKLPIKDILYFQSNNKKVEAFLPDEIQAFTAKLDDVQKQLEHSEFPFLRIHKSYLVSYRHIRVFETDKVRLKCEIELPISRKMKKQVDLNYAKLVIRTKGH